MAKFTRFDPRNKKQQNNYTKEDVNKSRPKIKNYDEYDISNDLLSKFATERFNGERSERK
jgi:hypothetical protein